MVKLITLFLIAMVALALIGRLRIPGRKPKPPGRLAAARCPRCGRPRIGSGPCDCGAKP